MKYEYDVCVIGAGPSGYAAAIRATDYGKKVALIEKNRVGGAGIYNGALSSKTLWELSERYKNTKDTRYGYSIYDGEVSFSAVINEMNRAVNERYVQLKEQLDYFQKKGQINFIHGKASLASDHEIVIQAENGSESTITAENIILAVGSKPRVLPQIPIDGKHIMTSDDIGSLTEFPKSIVILGAGVIGCEFATIFSNFGKTKVYLIDKADRILPFEDDDIAQTVSNNLEENGVHIHRGASLISMEKVDDKVKYTIGFQDGRQEIYTVDKALISVGRVPNSENMRLKEIGLELNDRGHCIDNDTETCIPNIYAVGDFTADIALVNIAELEGRHAIERIYEQTSKELIYNNISTIMFLNPEVAAVGLNESQARKAGISYKMAKMKYKYVSRAIAMRNQAGFIKLLVSNDDEMKILGLRVLGDHASSTIEAIALLMSLDKGVHELVDLIHPHPSIPEGIQECARMLLGKSVIKPAIFQMDLQCYSFNEKGEFHNLFEENLKTVDSTI